MSEDIKSFGFVISEVANLGSKPFQNVGKNVVTQARLGEPLVILEQKFQWYYVKMSDDYEGWISPKDIILVDENQWLHYRESRQVLITASFVSILHPLNFKVINMATLATRLKYLAKTEKHYVVVLPDGGVGLVLADDGIEISAFDKIPQSSSEDIIALGKKYMGLPYYWGGTTPYGFDCSGFVQTLFKINGIDLPRDACQQYEVGETVKNLEDLKKGDLVFFTTYKPGVSHVGIFIGDGEYIHSSGSSGVTINSFNPHKPNYDEELYKKYIGARRILC